MYGKYLGSSFKNKEKSGIDFFTDYIPDTTTMEMLRSALLNYIDIYRKVLNNWKSDYENVKNNKTSENKIFYFSTLRPAYLKQINKLNSDIGIVLDRIKIVINSENNL